jgi:ketosteroid isomerase-like protein
MSPGNAEIVKTAIDAFNRRDMRALADLSHEDLEIVSVLTAANLGGATYRGLEAWTSYFAAMAETWKEWQVEDVHVFDGSDDRVACLCRMVGEGKLSGAPVERAVGITYEFRQAQLWRVRSYLDPGEALEAVGLRE